MQAPHCQASFVADHGPWASAVVVHGLSRPEAYGIFLDQGLNQLGEFLTTRPPGKPPNVYFTMIFSLKNENVFLLIGRSSLTFSACLWKCCLLLQIPYHFLHPHPPIPLPVLGNCLFIFHLYAFFSSGNLKEMDVYNVYLLCDWLLSLGIMMFSSSSVLSCPPVLPFFLLLNTILWYAYAAFYLFCSLNSCFLLEVLPYNINSDITCSLFIKTISQSRRDWKLSLCFLCFRLEC